MFHANPFVFLTTILFTIFFILFESDLAAQMLQGGPNNMPGEVTSGAVNEGSVNGDVNLFTGTYDLTHTLGSVSGINGPSFTLTASYSSVATSGTLVPSYKGYPMGEGWSLNLPTVSCSVEDYEKYNTVQRDYYQQDARRENMFYLYNEVSQDKALYFFDVQYSIPGVGSGKLVYKYTIGRKHYFSPQTFESPVIVILDAGRWIITAPNGDRYEFIPQPVLRKNGNLRMHKRREGYRREEEVYYDDADNIVATDGRLEYDTYGRLQEQNVEPRESVTQWFCSKITNPFSTDAIFFEGEPYGKKIDHFSEWHQPALSNLPHNSAYNVVPQYYEGYLLKEVRSSTDLLELNYEEITEPSVNNLIEDVDFFYKRELVYDSEDDSRKWKGFKHVAMLDEQRGINASLFASPTNPYLEKGIASSGNFYNFDEDVLPKDFSHKFLESPAINLSNSGDYYEVEFDISGGGNPALFDLNVVAGEPRYHLGNRLSENDYQAERPINIHSTFQNPVKFYVREQNGITTFKSLFLPPALHPSNKFRVQIGPASSDNQYSLDLQMSAGQTPQPIYDGIPLTLRSYFDFSPGYWAPSTHFTDSLAHNALIGTGEETYNRNSPLYPTDPVPENFGIGYPWHSMIHFYDSEIFAPYYNGNERLMLGALREDFPSFKYPKWWKTDNPAFGNWPNEPTNAGDNVSLEHVKLYRYFKKNLLLAEVKKYVVNNVGSNTTPSIADVTSVKNEITNTQLSYEVRKSPYEVNYFENGENKTVMGEPIRTLLLRAIVNVPIGQSVPADFSMLLGNGTSYPTTSFWYESFQTVAFASSNIEEVSEKEAATNLDNIYVITGHESPLGLRTSIEYVTAGGDGSSGRSHIRLLDSQVPTNPTFGNSITSLTPNIKWPLAGNAVSKIVGVVDVVSSKVGTDEKARKYKFTSGVSRTGKTIPHKNLNDRYYRSADNTGYQSAVVYGPYSGDEAFSENTRTPVSIYKHFTDFFLFGKLKSSESLDLEGNRLNETSNRYEVSLAFEPGFSRHVRGNATDSDYFEYDDPVRAALPTDTCSNFDFNSWVEDILPTLVDLVERENGDTAYIKQYAIPKVSAQNLYSPFSLIPNHDRFDNKKDGYAAINTFLNESSVFIKLVESSSTDYLVCGEEDELGIMQTTSYTYYEAEYNGSYEAEEFQKIDPSLGGQTRLLREPSFLPASKTVSNVGAIASTTKEEYFYHWDLKNVADYTIRGEGIRIDQREFPLLYKIAEIDQRPVRNLVYETRTTYGDGTVQSVFNNYSAEVDFTDVDYREVTNGLTVVCPSDDNIDAPNGDCDFFNNGYTADCPNEYGCYYFAGTDEFLPLDYCREATFPKWICPCRVASDEVEIDTIFDDEPTIGNTGGGDYHGGGRTSNYKNFGYMDKTGGGPIPYQRPPLSQQVIPVLKSVFVQVGKGGDNGPRINFLAGQGLDVPTINVPNVKTYTLESRTPLNLPVRTVDAKGLVTRFDYAPTVQLFYETCERGQFVIEHSALFNEAAGLPVAVTVGDGLQYALTTEYEYDDRRTIRKVTDPNGIISTYKYDDFRRLEEAHRNGELLSVSEYSNYISNFATNNSVAVDAGLQNYVSTTSHLGGDAGSSKQTKYLDVYGRASGEEVKYDAGAGVERTHISGAPYYDFYGRVTATKPIGIGEPFLTSGADDTFINVDLYPAPRSQAIKTSRQGLALDERFKKTEICSAGPDMLEGEVLEAGNTVAIDYLPGIPLNRTHTTDEDGKEYVAYTDAAGLSIATISMEEGNAYAATVNQYDRRGNLKASVNPKGQITSYKYNYLGLPFEMSSPDAGVTKMAYDVEGKILATLDGEGKQTSFFFDAFGRQTLQMDGLSSDVFSNEGIPWLNNTENPGSYQVTYGDGVEKKREKMWLFNQYSSFTDFTPDVPADFTSSNTLGRLAATFSFDDLNNPILGTTYKYNNDGFITEEVSVFSNDSDEYLNYSVKYDDFLLNGTAGSVAVDVGNDGMDFEHRFRYDGLGRLIEVRLSAPEKGIDNQKFATYAYDPENTQLQSITYFSEDNEVLEVVQGYDVANRLTSISSPLFADTITYNKSDNEGYFNGNIYSIKSDYNIEPYLTSPSMMAAPSTYTYTYDGLNRLTEAKLDIDGLIFNHVEDLAGNTADFGTVSYGYDKIGNLESIIRGEYLEDESLIGKVTSLMKFPEVNNHLSEVTQSGAGLVEPQTFEYGHNGVGYMTFDGKRDKALTYTRGTYPLTAGTDTYAYDVNDARIHKKGEKNEFYLRNGSGQELAIINFDNLTASWYGYGVTRFAEIGTTVGNCGEVPCRPDAPIAVENEAYFDAQALSNAQATNINNLSYPLTLFRVQLPSDQDVYLLGSELVGLDGRFNILQQIIISSVGQLLQVENTVLETTEDFTFSNFLETRTSYFYDYLLNGFHICEEECPDDVFACDSGLANTQISEINALRTATASRAGKQQDPFTVVRIRLCNGTELYADQRGLSSISGAYLILQEIDVDPVDFEVITLANGNNEGEITTATGILPYLYVTDADWSLDEYEPCLSPVACSDDVPECTNGMNPDLSGVRDIMNNSEDAAGSISYPAEVLRVRFCNGTDLHMLPTELAQIADGGYKILQEVKFLTASTKTDVYYGSNQEDRMTLPEFLTARRDYPINRIGEYPDCFISSCAVPECSDSLRNIQRNTLQAIHMNPTARESAVNYPTDLNLIIVCGGNEYWLTNEEMSGLVGATVTGQAFTITSATQTFATQLANGSFISTDLGDFFRLDQNQTFISVNGLLRCGSRSTSDCIATGNYGCDVASAKEQIAQLESLPYYNNPCSTREDQLSLVELCDGTRLYLTETEITLMPRLIRRYQTIFSTGNQSSYQVVYNGETRTMTPVEIYCNRFSGLTAISTDDCPLATEEETVSCTTNINMTTPVIEALPNSYSVSVSTTIDGKQTCDDGSGGSFFTEVNRNYGFRSGFNRLICLNGSEGTFQFESIILKEVLTGSELTIQMSPEQLQGNYPGITDHLAGLNMNLNDLVLSSNGGTVDYGYHSLIGAVLRYVTSQHAGKPSSEINFNPFINVTRGYNGEECGLNQKAFGVRFGTYIMHQPSRTSYIIEPCKGNVKVKVAIEEAAVVLELDPVLELVSQDGKTSVVCTNGLNLFGPGGLEYEKSAKKLCVNDENLSPCTQILLTRYNNFGLTCEPDSPPEITFTISPTRAAEVNFDLTLLIGGLPTKGQTSVHTCSVTTTTSTLSCTTDPFPTFCYNGDCNLDPCNPVDFSLDCSPSEITERDDQLIALRNLFQSASATSVTYPTNLLAVTFCGEITRYLLPEEMPYLTVPHRITRRIPVATAATTLHINNGTTTNGTITDFITKRKTAPTTSATLAPAYTDPAPGLDPVTGLPDNGDLPDVNSKVALYLHDHLGNTRVTFRADAPDAIVIDFAADYYPYGKILRSYQLCAPNRFLSTHHERDAATGYDNRGARLYDSEIGRFLGVDPLADAAPGWTPYRYAFNNPIIYLDPDGRYEWRVNTKTGERIQIGGEGGKGTQHIYFDDSENISTTIEAENFYVGAIAKDRYSEGEFQYGVSEHDLWSDIPDEYQGSYDKFDLVERYQAQISGDAKYQSIREQESAGLSRSEMIWNFQDYGVHLDNKYGSQSALVMAHDVGLLGAMTPGGGINNALASYAKVVKASRGLRSMRSFNPKFGPIGRGNTSLVPYAPIKPLGRMSWNQFRSATKGQFKGPGHMRKAAEAYKKYKSKF